MADVFWLRREELSLTLITLGSVDFFQAFGGEKYLNACLLQHWVSWAGKESHLVHSLTEI